VVKSKREGHGLYAVEVCLPRTRPSTQAASGEVVRLVRAVRWYSTPASLRRAVVPSGRFRTRVSDIYISSRGQSKPLSFGIEPAEGCQKIVGKNVELCAADRTKVQVRQQSPCPSILSIYLSRRRFVMRLLQQRGVGRRHLLVFFSKSFRIPPRLA